MTADRPDRISEKLSLPGADADVAPMFSASGDASLEAVRRVHQQTWEVTLRLNREYRCGDEVNYQSSLRLSSRADAPPMSVMAPQRDCRLFTTTVHLAGLADQVWVRDGANPPTVNEDVPSGVVIDATAAPEPSVEFENLTPGMVYGLRWRWRSSEE